MNTICDIDLLIYDVSSLECVAPDEPDINTDSDDDDCVFDDGASGSRQCLSSSRDSRVDMELFVGLMKILVHDDNCEGEVPVNKRKTNYEELISHTVEEAETPEIAWYVLFYLFSYRGGELKFLSTTELKIPSDYSSRVGVVCRVSTVCPQI